MRSRWVQDPKTNKLVPRDEYYRRKEQGAYIQGDIEPFVSPVDGSLISSRSHLRDHNARHGVVTQAEYGSTHNEAARRRREAFFQGQHTPKEKFRRKQEIYNIIQRAIDNG